MHSIHHGLARVLFRFLPMLFVWSILGLLTFGTLESLGSINSFGSLQICRSVACHTLTDTERTHLRYHLENLFNEVDLVLKNHKADLSDIRKEERDFAELKTFERIPLKRDIQGLEQNLKLSADHYQLKTVGFTVTGYSRQFSKPPRALYTDAPPFRFSADQLVERIYFKIIIQTSLPESQIVLWSRKWKNDQLRITDLDSSNQTPAIQETRPGTWTVRGVAYRYRSVRFPTLRPRDPIALLPEWSRNHFKAFSKAEPILGSFVSRIKILTPRTPLCYEDRGRLLLSHARMDFFLSKLGT